MFSHGFCGTLLKQSSVRELNTELLVDYDYFDASFGIRLFEAGPYVACSHRTRSVFPLPGFCTSCVPVEPLCICGSHPLLDSIHRLFECSGDFTSANHDDNMLGLKYDLSSAIPERIEVHELGISAPHLPLDSLWHSRRVGDTFRPLSE